MTKMFKKTLALLLAITMLLGLSAVAFAKPTEWISQSLSDIPVIRLSGDGEMLVDEDGNKVFQYKDFGTLFSKDDEEEDDDNLELYASIANVLMPFLIDGALKGNWDPYYENLQKEIADLVEHSLLDHDGNPQYGTGVRQERLNKMEQVRHNNQWWRTADGQYYYVHDRYWFYYDWRLDPMETAAELKSYIDDILASTGSEQVGIMASCLGTNVVTAYLAVYPDHAKEHIRGIAYDGSVVGGAEMLSEAISGKFAVDLTAINRTINDSVAIGSFAVDDFVKVTLDMVAKTGVADALVSVPKNLLYDELVEGVTSSLALSTFYTWPNYWACVSKEDYPTAKEYVFGPEGSEKRTEYAGLIAKLDNYDTVVRQHVNEILTTTKNNGVHFGVISKYGFQLMPVCKTNDLVADQFASVTRSSFGATTGTIYQDLSDEYLAQRREAGFGDYLSPDGQIDASTCLFPESTWFIKGCSHSNWSDWELRLMYDIATSKEEVTVANGCWPSRFVTYSYTNPEEPTDGEIEVMTTENCDTENWEANEAQDHPANKYSKIYVAVTSLIKWLIALFKKIFH